MLSKTSWAVLNLNTRRPVKLMDVLPLYPVNPERALHDALGALFWLTTRSILTIINSCCFTCIGGVINEGPILMKSQDQN